MTTTHAEISTRRDTIRAALRVTAVAAVSLAVVAMILSFLTTVSGPFHATAITGQAAGDPAAAAAIGFPYRHLTVQPDSQVAGQATVTLDDGTGQPTVHIARSLPFDGIPYPTDPPTACDTDAVCWGDWTITPALDVTVSTNYRGATCVITGSADTRTRITCDGYTLPNG